MAISFWLTLAKKKY